nr:hypothetical protein [Tanacetum cinerariifolium]
MGYSFYYTLKNKVFIAQNAKFLENNLISQEASGSLEDLEIIQEEDTHPSIDTSLHHKEDDLKIDEPQSDIILIRRSTKTRHASDRMCLYINADEHELGDLGEPANYKAALLDPKSNKWLNAINVEMQSMKDYEDYTQTPGIDYEETFSLVVDIRAIRILIAITVFYDYAIWQMDVKTAFLNGYLSEEVYMEKPEDVKSYIRRCFAMKDLCEAVYILGIKIYRDRSRCIPMQEKLRLSKSQGASTPAELKLMQNVPYASASAKQSIFATLSAEAEYIAAYDAFEEAVWVRKFISGLGVVSTIKEPINMYCDNTGAITIANESGIT